MNEYELFAPIYDWILYPFMRGIRRDVLDIVRRLQPERILDVCCGTGDQMRLLQREGIQVIGIDISKAMLKVSAGGRSPVKCLAQDATAMAFQNSSFDLAMVSFALHETEWENAQMIVREVHRILKAEGNFLIVDYAFNPCTGAMVKAVIGAIEFMAGRRHFANFRAFQRNGGLPNLVDPEAFSHKEDRHHGHRSVVIRLMKKRNDYRRRQLQ